MLTVTRISKGKGPFYRVDLSEGEALQVSEDVLVRYRLLKDGIRRRNYPRDQEE